MIGALLSFLLTIALSTFVAAAPGPQAYTRTTGAGGVTVKVTYAPPEYFQAAKNPRARSAGAQKNRSSSWSH